MYVQGRLRCAEAVLTYVCLQANETTDLSSEIFVNHGW